MLQHFVWWSFALGLIVGIFGIFFVKPTMATIFKYPTPNECDKLIYKDKNGICYKYTTKEVNCDSNESRLKSFPLV
jgi:hypothetical protein